jgi:cytochrome c
MTGAQTVSSFIYANIIKGDPDLTEARAPDIAAFVMAQPRPHFAGR